MTHSDVIIIGQVVTSSLKFYQEAPKIKDHSGTRYYDFKLLLKQ